MVDVHLLLKSLRVVEDDVERIKGATTQEDVIQSFKEFGKSVIDLVNHAAKRQVRQRKRGRVNNDFEFP